VFRFLFNPRYPLFLLIAFIVYAAAWAIRPVNLSNWILENVLTAIAVAFLVWTYRRLPLSNISYTLIFLFLCLHTVGAHYTYSRVPLDEWFDSIFGTTASAMFGWQRKNFDRVVHFAFGLLISYPVREVFMRVARARGFWSYYLPLDVTISLSAAYELIEWGAASAFGGELGQAYLGTQGDEWDAHKDMALASLGALISMFIVALINWKFDKRFGDEWRQSLDATGRPPLGERRLAELLSGRAATDDVDVPK
jgi:putative membrane protein